MTTSIGKKLILPMFQLDTVVLLRANEAKSWGTSIYNHIEACWHMLLLIAHVGYVHWLSDLRCSQVDAAHMGFTSDLLVCGNPAVGYVIATVVIEVQALWCHLYAYYIMTN